MNIVLASSSTYRKKLLEPLIPSMICVAPDIDESVNAGESAENYVSRLALEKAKAAAKQQTDALVIGSDQCAVLSQGFNFHNGINMSRLPGHCYRQ